MDFVSVFYAWWFHCKRCTPGKFEITITITYYNHFITNDAKQNMIFLENAYIQSILMKYLHGIFNLTPINWVLIPEYLIWGSGYCHIEVLPSFERCCRPFHITKPFCCDLSLYVFSVRFLVSNKREHSKREQIRQQLFTSKDVLHTVSESYRRLSKYTSFYRTNKNCDHFFKSITRFIRQDKLTNISLTR